ncbi:hypothetical protein EV401DRAFT_1895306 [Pisolithus croceorrhizus]|nr:hypothetical protein EV401DRAFT_1895306 [Pisolithus croceorrhizus]
MWPVRQATCPRTARVRRRAVFAWSGTSPLQAVKPRITGANSDADNDSGDDKRSDEQGADATAANSRGAKFAVVRGLLPTDIYMRSATTDVSILHGRLLRSGAIFLAFVIGTV